MNNAASFKANQFASNAEDFLSKGDLQNACNCHFRAAEQFLLAMNDTKDPEVIKF
jgi:Archaeal PaREP1/PaREP8 family